MDLTAVSMYALMPNLDASMDLMADVIKNPAFDPQELERIRATQLTRIAAENTQPMSVALRTLPPLLFGKEHPYGVPFTGTGDPAVVQKLTRNDLASRSEEHTSELQSLMRSSYAVFCLQKKNN